MRYDMQKTLRGNLISFFENEDFDAERSIELADAIEDFLSEWKDNLITEAVDIVDSDNIEPQITDIIDEWRDKVTRQIRDLG